MATVLQSERREFNKIDNLSRKEIGKIFPVEIVPYNAEWQQLFEREKSLLTSVLTDKIVLLVEHIGSTSVRNLSAKPIIDILVAVPGLTGDLKNEITKKLSQIGYENMSDAETETKMTFGKGYDINERDRQKFHLHIRQQNSDLWNDEIYFRDYLRQNADARNEYETLKLCLAQLHKYDREAYTTAKTDFIKSIT
ncbi:MAG: GrpB family protein, partial [Prevotellaceae bacterium]|nr:GrpB family protein [Prevotellaceae bacterium]